MGSYPTFYIRLLLIPHKLVMHKLYRLFISNKNKKKYFQEVNNFLIRILFF